MLVLNKISSDPNVIQIQKIQSVFMSVFVSVFLQLKRSIEFHLTQRLFGKIKYEYGLFSFAKYGVNVTNHEFFKQADVVYVHWVRDFLSIRNTEQILKTGKQVVIFLHDMWHITGGCHYSFECTKYQVLCSHCPMFEKDIRKDCSYRLFKKKIKIFSKYANISFITPSKWLMECVSKSPFFQSKISHILPCPLDISVFKPINKQCARYALNLPNDKKIICFGAYEGITNPYKGWTYMEEALRVLKEEAIPDVEALIFGSEYSWAIADKVPFPLHFTGKLHDSYSLVLVYSAIDVYVTPTLADNLPQTCLEAMACGVPIVGFNVGGIPDMIEHEITGYLSKYRDSNDLVKGINYILTCENYEVLSCNAINKVQAMCRDTKIVSLHEAFLNNIINNK
jgi:glycosyltransferase involved in cell wall biosynthesis